MILVENVGTYDTNTSSYWRLTNVRVKASARAHCVRLRDRVPTDGLYDEVATFSGYVEFVNEVFVGRIKTNKDMIVPISFVADLLDRTGYRNAGVDHFEAVRVVDVLPERLTTLGYAVLRPRWRGRIDCEQRNDSYKNGTKYHQILW